MSSDIYAKPDLSLKVRNARKERESREEWEETEVDIYEIADDVVDNRTNFQSQEGEPQTPRHPTVQRGAIRGAVLYPLLCAVMLAGIITLSIYIMLTMSELNNSNSQLQATLADMKSNYSQLLSSYEILENKTKDMESNNSHLHSRNENLSKNYSQFMDEMKKLKNKIENKCCPDGWITFGCSCYFVSTETKTWSYSRKYCQDRGADLVIINSKEEQEFFSKLVLAFWIGLEWRANGYKWLDGSALTVTFWALGEQSSYNRHKPVYSGYEGKWTTAYSTDQTTLNWICEK